MLGTRLGPYRIEAELGSGGMGTVYAATTEVEVKGLEPGSRVALKVVHPHLVGQSGFFKRFVREGDVGRRVRHENVVSTFDIDAADVDGKTVLFLAMEYVEGRTLRHLLSELGAVPEVLLRELARQIAAGLSAIHAVGVVHRDLKPENVLVTNDEQVRIMDLGVARLVSESHVLTPTGHFAGSVLYAAPEQFRKEEVGPAADLYALGVLFYELATGDNPFRRDAMAAVVHAHLEEHAPALRERSRDISLFLSEVVETLLSKQPASRFESADVLRSVLEEGEAAPWWAEREHELRAARPGRPEIHVRRETALYGRDADLAVLGEAWQAVRAGRGATLLLEGEAGIGKTRLVDAFLDALDSDDAYVIYGSYLPTGGLGGLSDGILAHFGAPRLEESLRPYLSATPSLVPAFAALLRHEHPPTGAQEIDGDALHAVMVHLLRELAAEKPVVWIAEDLHFAPPESRRVLVSLARAVAGHPALLVATTRPGLPEDELAHLTRLENCRRHRVGRLSPREVMEMLREAFHSHALADRVGGRIAYKSDGVPFFVFEMIRGLKEGGYVTQGPDGTFVETRVVEDIEVPSAVWDLVGARLKELGRTERAILDVAAVQGFEFDADLVARVLDMKRIPVLQALAEVERHSGLVRAAGRLLRFDHHQVQEVLYQSLPEALRVEYHTELADACAEREGAKDGDAEALPDEICVLLTSHYLQGRTPEAALPYLGRALEHLGRSYRSQAVIEQVEGALALGELLDGRRRVELLLTRAAAHELLGSRDAQRTDLETARRIAETEGDEGLLARVLNDLGWYLVRIARYEDAEGALTEAHDRAVSATDEALQQESLQRRGVTLLYQGRYDEGRALLEKALALARQRRDRRGEAVALGSLGNVHRAHGRFDEALEHHERHRDLAREVGEVRSEVTALGNIGNVHTYQKRYTEAATCYAEALDRARQIGDRYSEALLLGNLAGSLQSQELFEGALTHYARALAIAKETANRQSEAHLRMNIGQLLGSLGDLPGAAENLQASLAAAQDIGDPRVIAYATSRLAEIDLARGDLEGAWRRAEEAEALFREREHQGGMAQALLVLAQLLELRGDSEAARGRYEAALASYEKPEEDAGGIVVAARLCALTGRDVEATRGHFERAEGLSATSASEAAFHLWKATGDDVLLERAWNELSRLLDAAPSRYRESMVGNVPLNRDVHAAWQERSRRSP